FRLERLACVSSCRWEGDRIKVFENYGCLMAFLLLFTGEVIKKLSSQPMTRAVLRWKSQQESVDVANAFV
ncbi:MAG: hypothetical protein Q6K08_08170, partial [Thermostichales cyanobacterium GMQP_bins_62]